MRAGHTTVKDLLMDRRDALKKLGMGGATVVGATMIVSSPAFGATLPAAPTPAVDTNLAESTATFSVTLNDPQCTGGSDPNGSTTLVSTSVSGDGTTSGLTLTALAAAPNNGKFKSNDTAQFTVTTESTCTYSNTSETPVQETYVFNYSYDSSAKTFVLLP